MSHRLFLALLLSLIAVDAGAAQTTPILVTTTADSGPGSVRQAILDANASPGPDAIHFAIPGAGPRVIVLATPLPEVTDPVTIDGATQPGYVGRPLVEIRGIEGMTTLQISAGSSTVRALAINSAATGIRLYEGDGNTVEGCYIGTDASGLVAMANAYAGIHVYRSNGNRIGGSAPGAGNLISGNGGWNQGGGGVFLENSADTIIQGNLIGTDVTGALPLGNSGAGVRCEDSRPTTIGGTGAGEGNTIAYNGGPGVYSRTGNRITILSNSIFENNENVVNANEHYGIHYEFASFAPAPSLTFVAVEGAATRVAGAMYYSDGPLRVEFFRNPGCGGPGQGQGKTFVGALDVSPDARNIAAFSHLLPFALGRDETITATATSPNGTTSLFSECRGDTDGCELPFITTRRETFSIPAGTTITLDVDATGSGPFSYQWYRIGNGTSTPIAGATSRSYTPPPLTDPSNFFRVVVISSCGTDSLQRGVYTCTSAPAIAEQPQGATVPAGTIRLVSVAPVASGFVTYQWYQGERGDTSSPLGAMQSQFQTPALYETTSYWVRISNGCGSVDSDTATFVVVPAIEVTTVKVARNAAGKIKLVAKGRNLGSEVFVSVNGVRFEKPPKISGKKIVQSGNLVDGRTIDEAIPPGQTVQISFFSSERGFARIDYTRP